MSTQRLYGFAEAIEDPVAEILTSEGIKACTPRNTAKFQEIRPRVELVFQLGAEKGSYHILTSGEIRNASWFGRMDLTVITNSGDNGADGQTSDASAAHRTFRASVRNVFSTLKWRLNGMRPDGNDRYVPCHQIQRINEISDDAEYKADQGTEKSKMSFNVEFGVRKDAWGELDPATTFPASTVP